MSQADLIDDLAAHSAQLDQALQSGNAETIEQATARFSAALSAIQAANGWAADSALNQHLRALQRELDDTRKLACLLADMTAQMHDLTAAGIRGARQPLYKRSGARAG